MSEPEVLSRVISAFEPFSRNPVELGRIRSQIAEHITSLQASPRPVVQELEPLSIPSYVTGIRKRYLEARHANIAAEYEHDQLLSEMHSSQTASSKNANFTTMLQGHLEGLRLQKRYQQYQSLSYYITQAEDLAKRGCLYDDRSSVEITRLETENACSVRTSALESQLQDLIRSLETTVLQRNHGLEREMQLLESVKRCQSAPENSSAQAKLYALSATRVELTAWIEECLSSCDLVDRLPTTKETTSSTDFNGQEHDTTSFRAMVDEQYENYVKARTRLLEATSNVMQPPSTMSSARFPISQHTDPTHILSDSTSHVPALTLTTPFLDSQHLQIMSRYRAIRQFWLQSGRTLSECSHDLSEQLLRLRDESHLLPSFPILVKSNPSADSNDKDGLLRAWHFAIDAATTATAAAIDKQVDTGKRAIEQMNTVMDEQNEVTHLWEKL